MTATQIKNRLHVQTEISRVTLAFAALTASHMYRSKLWGRGALNGKKAAPLLAHLVLLAQLGDCVRVRPQIQLGADQNHGGARRVMLELGPPFGFDVLK